jgi:hypothetical protein
MDRFPLKCSKLQSSSVRTVTGNETFIVGSIGSVMFVVGTTGSDVLPVGNADIDTFKVGVTGMPTGTLVIRGGALPPKSHG